MNSFPKDLWAYTKSHPQLVLLSASVGTLNHILFFQAPTLGLAIVIHVALTIGLLKTLLLQERGVANVVRQGLSPAHWPKGNLVRLLRFTLAYYAGIYLSYLIGGSGGESGGGSGEAGMDLGMAAFGVAVVLFATFVMRFLCTWFAACAVANAICGVSDVQPQTFSYLVSKLHRPMLKRLSKIDMWVWPLCALTLITPVNALYLLGPAFGIFTWSYTVFAVIELYGMKPPKEKVTAKVGAPVLEA
ncbi:hypothetical protein [Ferrimonas marina]|uniref:Uncharacterized protein n=1 Tax=Ferrimonas marina TaxID=299255 RepID=A0A1M5TSD3_9GAMM|nr:hypothetical protein [Ferrimonas marina]SHH53687.1 hypothetical protein SAMN02745129_2261 [Ferrimonas marina]